MVLAWGFVNKPVEEKRESRNRSTHIHSVDFQQRCHDNVKRKVLTVLQLLDMHMAKINFDLYFIPYTKVTQSVKAKTLKLLE